MTILCVGRLVVAKGQVILLQAAELLKREGVQFRLVIVGEGPDRQRLEKEAEQRNLTDCVQFRGGLNPSAVLDAYKEADIFCLPSFAEGVPVVLMEAMAMELPCVSTYVAGIPELIQSGENGLLVSPSNSPELANALKRLLESVDLRAQLGKNGRRQICEKYNLKKNMERLARVMEEFQ